MFQPVTAIFPGTFDPITSGHHDLIRRGTALFSNVVIAVATAHHKKTLFSLEERLDMAREVFKDSPRVRVEPFTGLVTDFAKNQGAGVLLRGVRSVTDFDYESQLAGMNRSLVTNLETVFLTADSRWQFVSSTLVREIALLGGDVSQFVAPSVLSRLMQKRAPSP